jgi:hypothetical protein
MNRHVRTTALTALIAGAVVTSVTTFGSPASAEMGFSQRFEVVATGLDNPRGITPGPGGTLLVAEAGRGGIDCVTASPTPDHPQGSRQCLGDTGKIDVLVAGHRFVVATLPSIAAPDGSSAAGPTSVELGRGGVPMVSMNDAEGQGYQGDVSLFAKTLRLTHRKPDVVGDLQAFEAANNPEPRVVDSNPYALAVNGRVTAVADAGGNDLVEVAADGTTSLLAVFPTELVPFPAGVAIPGTPPPGTPFPVESVPTSVTVGPDGAYYVGELRGFPFPAGASRVWRVVPGQAPTVYASGFTAVIDVQFDRHGNLYVLELAKNGLLSGDPTGALIRVGHDGSRTEIASTGLRSPGGVAIDDAGRIFVTNNSTSAGSGQVLRIK